MKVKRVLDIVRDDNSWDEFPLEIAQKARLANKLLALKEFEKIFNEGDAENLEGILAEVKLR